VTALTAFVAPLLPAEKPRHLLGIGDEQSFEACIAAGIDTFGKTARSAPESNWLTARCRFVLSVPNWPTRNAVALHRSTIESVEMLCGEPTCADRCHLIVCV